jgi:hypothetical protein
VIRATIKLSISSQYLEIPLGASAPEISKRKHDALWQWGAVGEYLVATSLHRALGHNAVILNDHKVPGRQANIDHLVVAPSGVWVFDAKKRSGLIEYKNVGGGSSEATGGSSWMAIGETFLRCASSPNAHMSTWAC